VCVKQQEIQDTNLDDIFMERISMPLLLLEAFAFFGVLGGTSPLVHSAATNGALGVLQPSRRRHCNTETHKLF